MHLKLCMPEKEQEQKEKESKHDPLRALCAEFLGTMILVFVGGFAGASSKIFPTIDHVAKGAAPGMAILALIYMGGNVSGMHINPAVTTLFALRKVFPWAKVPAYWAAQIGGSLAGAGIVKTLTKVGSGETLPHIDAGTAIGVELMLSMVLYWVIIGTANKAKIIGPDAAIAVGATVALCGLIADPVTGASMNPARSFGPAIVSGHTDTLWIYLVAPFSAAILVATLSPLVFKSHKGDEKEAAQGDGG